MNLTFSLWFAAEVPGTLLLGHRASNVFRVARLKLISSKRKVIRLDEIELHLS